MNRNYFFIGIAVALLVGVAAGYGTAIFTYPGYHPSFAQMQSVHSASTTEEVSDQDPAQYTLIAKGAGGDFYCKLIQPNESAPYCEIRKKVEGYYWETGLYGSEQSRTMLVSPDKAHILLVYAGTSLGADYDGDRAYLINVSDGSIRVIYRAPDNLYLGVLDSNIGVHGRARWVDTTHIEFNVYEPGHAGTGDRNQLTGEDGGKESKPLRTEIVTIKD